MDDQEVTVIDDRGIPQIEKIEKIPLIKYEPDLSKRIVFDKNNE